MDVLDLPVLVGYEMPWYYHTKGIHIVIDQQDFSLVVPVGISASSWDYKQHPPAMALGRTRAYLTKKKKKKKY